MDKLVRYINTSVFKNNIEYEDAIFKRLAAQFETLKSGHYTVVLMGSSQTWGAGAATAADKLETYLQNGLRAQHRKSDVTLINTAVSGASLSRMWKAIEPYREKRIDLIILNASNNDFDAASFRRELQKLSDFAIEKNIVLVLVGEANYFMDPNWNIFENHKSMRQLASAQGWKFINMHEEMAAIYNLGYFWWDNVHMTSAGQKKVSEIILKNLR